MNRLESALAVVEKTPRWTELPMRTRDLSPPELDGFEINTGRLAMVGFVGLLAREIVSGESFGQQFIDVLSTASGVNVPV